MSHTSNVLHLFVAWHRKKHAAVIHATIIMMFIWWCQSKYKLLVIAKSRITFMSAGSCEQMTSQNEQQQKLAPYTHYCCTYEHLQFWQTSWTQRKVIRQIVQQKITDDHMNAVKQLQWNSTTVQCTTAALTDCHHDKLSAVRVQNVSTNCSSGRQL